MTTTDSIWAAAEHLLRRDAEELRESSTSPRDRDDWTGEEEAKGDYDEHIAAADALASLSTLAAQPAGEYPPLPWDSDFEAWLEARGESDVIDALRAYVDADRALRAAHRQAPAPVAVAGPDRQTLIDVIAQGLSGTWHCLRVWNAWSFGTMSQDDFVPVDESDTPAELADAVLALLSTAPTTQAAPAAALPEQDRARGAQEEREQ